MAKTIIIPENLEIAAQELTQACLEKLKSAGSENAGTLFQDMQYTIVHKAAQLGHADINPNIADESGLEWEISRALPDFNFSANQMLSIWSLAAGVAAGWVLGGLLSTLLGFLALGGEIIRPVAIFAMLWLIDYLASNPAAKKRLLKIFGWTSLAGFAAKVGSGLLHFGNGWRTLIFGGLKPGFFKSIWLWLGAFFIFIFFAKKATRKNPAELKAELESQIKQKLYLSYQIFSLINQYASHNQADSQALASCKREKNTLAEAIISLLDSFEPEKRDFLLAALGKSGITLTNPDDSKLIWNKQKHEPLYDQLGFINDGDQVLILQRPVLTDGLVKKGLVQVAKPDPEHLQ